MKSSYELAMERMGGITPLFPLNKKIGEVDSKYKEKVAEHPLSEKRADCNSTHNGEKKYQHKEAFVYLLQPNDPKSSPRCKDSNIRY